MAIDAFFSELLLATIHVLPLLCTVFEKQMTVLSMYLLRYRILQSRSRHVLRRRESHRFG